MSTVTFGPAVSLDAPLPAPPSYTLVQTVPVIEEATVRWLNGGAVWGWPPDTGEAFDPCSTGTFREKEEGGAAPLPEFGAFTAYLPMTCGSLVLGNDPEEFATRALAAFAARESGIVEHELVTGDVMTMNPHFADGNVQILPAGGAPVSPAEGLSLLEGAIGKMRQAGVIHAPPSIASQWAVDLQRDAPRVRTISSWTPVVVGGGYEDTRPEGAAALTADQQYAWATLGVQIRRTEARLNPDAGRLWEALDRGQNVVTFRAERDYLVIYEPPSDDWDGGLQAAVLIDRSLSP